MGVFGGFFGFCFGLGDPDGFAFRLVGVARLGTAFSVEVTTGTIDATGGSLADADGTLEVVLSRAELEVLGLSSSGLILIT